MCSSVTAQENCTVVKCHILLRDDVAFIQYANVDVDHVRSEHLYIICVKQDSDKISETTVSLFSVCAELFIHLRAYCICLQERHSRNWCTVAST